MDQFHDKIVVMGATDSLVEEVRHKIIAARKRKGLSRPKVAQQLGMTASNYRYFENGRSVIGLAYLLQLPEILDVPISELLPDVLIKDKQGFRDPTLAKIEPLWLNLEPAQREAILTTIKGLAEKNHS